MVKGATWVFSAFLIIAMMGMLMIMFQSVLHPTEFVEEGELVSRPMEYVEEHEITYEPHQVEKSLLNAEMAGLNNAQPIAVITGVAAEAAIEVCPWDEEDESPFSEHSGKDAIKAFDENGNELKV